MATSNRLGPSSLLSSSDSASIFLFRLANILVYEKKKLLKIKKSNDLNCAYIYILSFYKIENL
jgi:hypothetical protein